MMNERIDNENINQWIERFLAAETTCEEERRLYDYFRRKNIPEEVEPYREMMMWYASGMDDKVKENHKTRRKLFFVLKWCAACLLVILSLSGLRILASHQNEFDDDYLIYEGSYIIRNGQMITNLDEILPELKAAEEYVESQSVTIPSIGELKTEVVTEDFLDEEDRKMVVNVLFEN